MIPGSSKLRQKSVVGQETATSEIFLFLKLEILIQVLIEPTEWLVFIVFAFWRKPCSVWGGQDAEFKFESKFELLQVILQYLQRLFEKVIEGLEGKINGQALGAKLGQLYCSICAGRTGELKHRAFPSRQQSLRATTGSLEENMLHSCSTDSVQESTRF